jgi:hypothetical protein
MHSRHQPTVFFIVRSSLVSRGAPRYAQGLASPTLRNLATILRVPDRRPPPRRAQ